MKSVWSLYIYFDANSPAIVFISANWMSKIKWSSNQSGNAKNVKCQLITNERKKEKQIQSNFKFSENLFKWFCLHNFYFTFSSHFMYWLSVLILLLCVWVLFLFSLRFCFQWILNQVLVRLYGIINLI